LARDRLGMSIPGPERVLGSIERDRVRQRPVSELEAKRSYDLLNVLYDDRPIYFVLPFNLVLHERRAKIP